MDAYFACRSAPRRSAFGHSRSQLTKTLVVLLLACAAASRTYVKLSVGVLAMRGHEAAVIAPIPGIAQFPISLFVVVLPILLVRILVVVVVVLRVLPIQPVVTV